MAAAWFKGVQCRVCLESNDTGNTYFRNALRIPRALQTIATIVMCAPESITAEPDSTTHLKKQADLYLQRRELDRDFAGSSVLFCASKLTVVD